MRYNIFTLLFILSFFLISNAQKTKENKEYLNAITISPISLIDPIHPTIQIGYQRQINDTWEAQADVGYIFNKILMNYLINLLGPNAGYKDPNKKIKGFKVRAELKRIYKRRRRTKAYLSAEVFYIRKISELTENFKIKDQSYNYSFEIDDGVNYYDDSFITKKSMIGLNIKWGMKIFIGQLVLEPHAGIGTSYRMAKHFGRENLNDSLTHSDFFTDAELGNKIVITLPINLRVGYRF